MYDRVLTILAGGTSRRFQKEEGQWSDKALMNHNDKPLLVNTLEKCEGIFEEVGISVNTKKREKVYSKIIKSYFPSQTTTFIVDSSKINLDGVLKGIYTSMYHFEDKEIQFIPSDRPYLLFEIFNKLKVKDNGVTIMQYSDGMIEPLLALYGRNSRIPSVLNNLSLSRADVPIRLAESIQTYNINEIVEKSGISIDIFANINVQADLRNHQIESAENTIVIPIPKLIEKTTLPDMSIEDMKTKTVEITDMLMKGEHFYGAYLWVLSSLRRKIIDRKKFNELGKLALRNEKIYWKEKCVPFLELHVLQDLISNFPEEQTKDNLSSMLKLKEKMKIKPRRVD